MDAVRTRWMVTEAKRDKGLRVSAHLPFSNTDVCPLTSKPAAELTHSGLRLSGYDITTWLAAKDFIQSD